MGAVDWKGRWEAGQIGFHLPEIHPSLRAFVHRLDDGDPGKRVYVPLAGKTLDIHFLRERGHDVIASELVELAVEQFFDAWDRRPARSRRGKLEILAADGVTFLVGDALKATTQVVGTIDAVYDRAALVALAPEERRVYADVQTSLLGRGGRMLLVTLEHDATSGPPHAVDRAEVDSLFGTGFEVETLTVTDALETSPSVVQKGATYVREVASLLVRR